MWCAVCYDARGTVCDGAGAVCDGAGVVCEGASGIVWCYCWYFVSVLMVLCALVQTMLHVLVFMVLIMLCACAIGDVCLCNTTV